MVVRFRGRVYVPPQQIGTLIIVKSPPPPVDFVKVDLGLVSLMLMCDPPPRGMHYLLHVRTFVCKGAQGILRAGTNNNNVMHS